MRKLILVEITFRVKNEPELLHTSRLVVVNQHPDDVEENLLVKAADYTQKWFKKELTNCDYVSIIPRPTIGEEPEQNGIPSIEYKGEAPQFVVNQDKAGSRWATWLSVASTPKQTFKEYSERKESSFHDLCGFGETPEQSAQNFIKTLSESDKFQIVLK